MNNFNLSFNKISEILLTQKQFNRLATDELSNILNISHQGKALLAYFDDKKEFKNTIRYGSLDDINWLYFKLNACVYFHKHTLSHENKLLVKGEQQQMLIKSLDFIRFINTWHASYLLSKDLQSEKENIFIDKKYLSGERDHDVLFLTDKAKELSEMLGYKDVESFFNDALLSIEACD